MIKWGKTNKFHFYPQNKINNSNNSSTREYILPLLLPFFSSSLRLNHSLQQFVDLVLAISVVTALNKMVGLFVESAQRVAQFEWPKEIGHLLEMRANSPNLLNYEIFCLVILI